jgi:hypothetical protein
MFAELLAMGVTTLSLLGFSEEDATEAISWASARSSTGTDVGTAGGAVEIDDGTVVAGGGAGTLVVAAGTDEDIADGGADCCPRLREDAGTRVFLA